MEPLDLDALLKKNPQVDKSMVKKRERNMKKPAKTKTKQPGGIASPYGSSRVSREHESWSEDVLYRPYYRGV